MTIRTSRKMTTMTTITTRILTLAAPSVSPLPVSYPPLREVNR